MSTPLKDIAKQAISLLDLTNLNDDCAPADIKALCERAKTEFGNTAAVCIWPEFIGDAATHLKGTGIKIATVVNFPKGASSTQEVEKEARAAVETGADEIDLVFPYQEFLNGNTALASEQILAIRQVCLSPVKLKVILETGELKDASIIKKASLLAIDRGADFIKTSTGKVAENATLTTARIMLDAIKQSGEPVGFKPAGGIKTTQDASDYLALCDEIMGAGWAKPETFRFGASGVLTDLLATLTGQASQTTDGY